MSHYYSRKEVQYMNYLAQWIYRMQSYRRTATLSFVFFMASIALPIHLHAQWVNAYYAGWEQGNLPPQSIDYSALTHICHFALVPNSNGTLNDQANSVTASNASAVIAAAHAAG